MPEDINEDYKKLVSEENCSYRNPDEVREEFLSYMEKLH